MKELLKSIFFGDSKFDSLIEGVYAHQYTDTLVRDEISTNYAKRYNPEPDPISHPENFDPLNPPKGWAYDPFYEIWVKF